jgi:hypothetical protein
MGRLTVDWRKNLPGFSEERDQRHHYICGFANRTHFEAPHGWFYFLTNNKIKSPTETGDVREYEKPRKDANYYESEKSVFQQENKNSINYFSPSAVFEKKIALNSTYGKFNMK